MDKIEQKPSEERKVKTPVKKVKPVVVKAKRVKPDLVDTRPQILVNSSGTPITVTYFGTSITIEDKLENPPKELLSSRHCKDLINKNKLVLQY
jgi:hypothetical protein